MKRNTRISLILMLLSLSLFCCYHIYYSFLDKSSDDLIRNYYLKESDSKSSLQSIVNKDHSEKEEYLGIISIPKIKLQTGFYNKNSKKNNVNDSVMILKESVLPNNSGSIIYLAAHSGTGYLAFFKDLNKLTYGDIINVSINKDNYQYVVSDIYEMVRNGTITVNHNINEKYLVLTTCSNNKNMQIVIVAKMVNKV